MRRSVAWTVFSLLFPLAGLAQASCSQGATQGTGSTSTSSSGAGGATSSSVSSSVDSTSSTSSSTGPGAPTSVGAGVSICDKDDGKCDLENETCMCQDCTATAMCIPDLCTSDGVCDPLFDSCICADCTVSGFCSDVQKRNCTDDGKCDSFVEGCLCADCASKPSCKDEIKTCKGASRDGACAADEPCSCPDCFGKFRCAECKPNGKCEDGDPCNCPDCLGPNNKRCAAPASCVNDGVCDIYNEGCYCDDCLKLCQGGGDTGGGGARVQETQGAASASDTPRRQRGR